MIGLCCEGINKGTLCFKLNHRDSKGISQSLPCKAISNILKICEIVS